MPLASDEVLCQVSDAYLRLDMLVEDKVIIELKSVKELLDVHFKQTLTYCKLLNKRIGILVNFYVDDILDNAIHRIVNNL